MSMTKKPSSPGGLNSVQAKKLVMVGAIGNGPLLCPGLEARKSKNVVNIAA